MWLLGEFDELPHQAAAVRRQAVPDRVSAAVAVDVALMQSLQLIVDDFQLADGAGIEPEVESCATSPRPTAFRQLKLNSEH